MEQSDTELSSPIPLETTSKVRALINPTAPKGRDLNALMRAFSPSERLLLYVLTIILGLSAFILLANVNTLISTEVPTRGGTLIEGGVGTPRFINPLLAVSDPDQDIATLVYSGLLRAIRPGEYVPDLAESYDISPDGTTYTFHLRKDLTFHDGTPLTAQDILFTIALAQNSEIKSPRRSDWEDVSVSAPDQATVVFTLPHAYALFRENATIGILPKHVWENVNDSEFPFSALNTHPIGSGPYRIRDVLFDETGIPTEYHLSSFAHFALGEPNVSALTYRVFANDDALLDAYHSGDIQSFVATTPKNLPRELQESEDLQRASLTRVFGIFLNQNHAPALANASVREALDEAVDKENIINSVLGGYGTALDGPVPPGLLPTPESDAFTVASTSVIVTTLPDATSTPPRDRIADAQKILTSGGWKFDTTDNVWKRDKTSLSLTLATADTEELVATAHAVADAWIAVGIPTTVQVYPLQEFNSTILRPRAYDAILFGEVVGRSLDLFAFWHSSQRNDPGLNLSLYTNTQADKILASARAESDLGKRQEFLLSFLETLDEDMPAVFLYAPQLAYVVPSRLNGVEIGTLTTPGDRFLGPHSWYRDTERVWQIFAQ